MSGVTDLPFRQLACATGQAGRDRNGGKPGARRQTRPNHGRACRVPGIDPHIVQLAGREAHWMAEAARIVADNGAAVGDINMAAPPRR